MKNFTLQHFRFNTGEEIICEILEWEEDCTEILVRNAMAIETMLDREERIYMFKPWLLYIESPHEIIIINTANIVANTSPNDLLALQYYSAVKEMEEIADDRIQHHNKKEAFKLKRIMEQIADLKKDGKVYKEPILPDNVIKFPDRNDIIH